MRKQLDIAWKQAEKIEEEEHEHQINLVRLEAVSYTHLRAHETVLDLVCRLLLEKKKKHNTQTVSITSITDTTQIHITNNDHIV